MRRSLGLLAVVLSALLVWPAAAQQGRPERIRIVLAVGGKEALVYLPLTVAERLGYLRETLTKKFFPLLWEARTFVERDG